MDKPTDERFVYYYPSQIIKDKQTGERHYGNKSLADLLNELHEENHSLKFQLDECQNHKLFSRRELEKENEQLKCENELLRNTIEMYDGKRERI